MLEIKNNINCCGCHACLNICPKEAIKMFEDEKGFLYPKIDKTKCINCGLCEKVCPIINNKKETKNKIQAYACYNKNIDERIKSSSGGIFILLAKKIIDMNGVVFGACFDEYYNVIHTYVTKKDDLTKFMGSKYVQSKIGTTYKEAKNFLDNGRIVLFTGTPCQIEGLKSYLKKEYKNLYTQDIICHGVPSPKVWKKYLEYRLEVDCEKPVAISFRNKDDGWQLFNLKFTYSKKEYKQNLLKDAYLKLFLDNISLRDSCYDCHFKKENRVSDITLGDYWGIDEIHPELNDNKGISLIFINSKQGEKLLDLIEYDIFQIKTDFNHAIKHNSAFNTSVQKNKRSDNFFADLDKLSYDKLMKKYVTLSFFGRVKRKLKIVIKKALKIN